MRAKMCHFVISCTFLLFFYKFIRFLKNYPLPLHGLNLKNKTE